MSPYAHFTEDELRCRCGCELGTDDMDPSFMAMVVRLRLTTGIPMPLTSAIRCKAHDLRVSTSSRAGEGAHTFGRAVDISAAGMTPGQKHELMAAIYALGFTGVGCKFHGHPDEQSIHIDNLKPMDGWPRSAVWTYL